ncbi:MAG: asparagine synthase-related protein [Terriglobales bacterium]
MTHIFGGGGNHEGSVPEAEAAAGATVFCLQGNRFAPLSAEVSRGSRAWGGMAGPNLPRNASAYCTDRHLALVDGTILNADGLARELALNANRQRSDDHAEVVAAAFSTWGSSAFGRMRGEFALAIHVRDTRRLFLATDHFGARSIYWTQQPQFLFSSHLVRLLELRPGKRRLDASALRRHLLQQPAQGNATLFQGIFRLPPAHVLEVDLDTGVLDLRPYWRWAGAHDSGLTLAAAAEDLRERLRESLRLHLHPDSEVGCTLSGGLDSSLLVSMAAQIAGPEKMVAFAFQAGPAVMSELPAAQASAQAAGVRLVEVTYDAQALPADFDSALAPLNEPCPSPVLFADRALYASACTHSRRTLISGHGPDTLLAGGSNHYSLQVASLFRAGRLSASLRTLWNSTDPTGRSLLSLAASAAVAALPAVREMISSRREHDQLCGINPVFLRPDAHVAPVTLRNRESMLQRQMRDELEWASVPRVLQIEHANAEAMGMRASFPFLTPEIAELAGRLRTDLLLAEDGSSKAVLREAAKGLVPPTLTARGPRLGFVVPSQAWLEELQPWAADRLRNARALPIFDEDVIDRTWSAWKQGQRRPQTTMLIWQWIMLAGWLRLLRAEFD